MSDEEDDEPLDPRIQNELERLNKASLLINKLENDLDDARGRFRSLLTESTQQLEGLSRKLGSCIEKAKPYYDCRLKAKEVQAQTHQAAMKYERAFSQQAAAREMVELAEQGYQNNEDQITFDTAWQEMLNHATMKVMDAENERVLSEAEHQRVTNMYAEVQEEVNHELKENKRSISKSKTYYEMKASFHASLETQKGAIEQMQSDVEAAKKLYSKALSNLEDISIEIHNKRKNRKFEKNLGEREAGVGSESPLPPPCDDINKPNNNNNKIKSVNDEIIISYPPVEGMKRRISSVPKSRLGSSPHLTRQRAVSSPQCEANQRNTPTPPMIACERLMNTPTPPPETHNESETKSTITKQETLDGIDISGIHIDITSADIDSPRVSPKPSLNDISTKPATPNQDDFTPMDADAKPTLTNKNSLPIDMTCVSANSASSSRTASPVIMRHKRGLSGSLQLCAKRLLHETSSIDSDSTSVSSFAVMDDEGVVNAMSAQYFENTTSFEEELRNSTHEDYSRLPARLSAYQKSYDTARKSITAFPSFEEADMKVDQVLRLLEDSESAV